MIGKLIPQFTLAGVLLAGGVAWAAAPSIDQVYQAAKAGEYDKAQSMMDEVLREHPGSAKAHFIEAELLAKQGKLPAARGELDTAQRLDPSMSFAKPEALQELKTKLAANVAPGNIVHTNVTPAPSANLAQPQGSHVPWGMLLIALVVVVVAVALWRSRSRNSYDTGSYGGSYQPAMNPMPGGGYGGAANAPPASGMGSGILGGLATGAAVGAGMVAGEALASKLMGGDGHSSTAQAAPLDSSWNNPTHTPSYDMGGNDFGVKDADSWGDANISSSDDWGDSGSSGDDWS
ncbi:MAG: tetratricopeptide repeat protein [Gallionellaceae bacterium]|jgi:hypothetical protein|nr:tetratricopeptide repeat protein [Gallionellaceae bacterium]